MATISPHPFPESGQRKLSAREAMQRAKAAACTVPKDKKPTCSGQVFVGLFFDGTGNNRVADYEEPPVEERKHSNVVRLFHTFRDEEKKVVFATTFRVWAQNSPKLATTILTSLKKIGVPSGVSGGRLALSGGYSNY